MTDPTRNLRAAYAKHILFENLKKRQEDTGNDGLQGEPELKTDYGGRICIIGAGAAGLYLAMMLKYLKITNVDILEASDRVGGRLFTYPHPYPGDTDHHNYYDVGAMRIPDIPWMQGVLHFLDYLGMSDKVKEYIYNNTTDPAPSLYWYKRDPIPPPTPPKQTFDQYMASINADFQQNFDTAFGKWLSGDRDNWSTKGFFMSGPKEDNPPNPPYDYNDVANTELGVTSTGLFDQSFTETVIDYADFHASDDTKWYRIDGGIQLLAENMKDKLASESWPEPNSSTMQVMRNTAVVKMEEIDTPSGCKIRVHFIDTKPTPAPSGAKQNFTSPQDYDMVFNTTAMAPLQQMDLEGLKLPDEVLTGIRALSYDRATKVMIRFKEPWWFKNKDHTKIFGGVSSTDLPISNVVYPSWNDGPDRPATLMVSYSWAQDATRMGSLVRDYTVVKPTKDDPIVTLCLQNLVKLWAGQEPKPTFDYLKSLYHSHHAWAWSHDPWTGGAFALFAPGQYKNVYHDFQYLFCHEKLAFCGEALSAHHAWISGAFDSSYLMLYKFLYAKGLHNQREALKESPFGGGQGRHPDEMDPMQQKKIVNWGCPFEKAGK